MTTNKLASYFFVILLSISFVMVVFIFAPYLSVFVLSLVLGIIFRPIHNKIHKYLNNAGFASIVSTIIVLLIILGPVAFIITQLFKEASSLSYAIQNNTYDLSSSISAIQSKLQHYFPYLNIDVKYYVDGLLNWIVQNAGTAFTSAAQIVMNLLLSGIGLYYWFKDGDRLKDTMMKLSPMPAVDNQNILDKLSGSVHSIISGTLVVAVVQGILAGIGFTIFGIPNAVIWGTITALSALIPGVGTSLILLPAVAYLFIIGENGQAIGLLIWAMFAVGLVDNFLGPKLMSRGNQIHPFFILISVLGGIKLLGPVGFLAGPLALTLFFSLLDIYAGMAVESGTDA